MPFASTPTTVDRAFDLRAFLAAPPLGLSDYGDLESALSTYGATSLAFLANAKPEDLQMYGGIPIGKAAAIVNVAKMRVNTNVKPSAGPSAPPPDELAQNPQAMQLAVELTQNPQAMQNAMQKPTNDGTTSRNDDATSNERKPTNVATIDDEGGW